MPGTYNGGGSVITIRRSEKDMERRKEHWAKKRDRAQAEFDAKLASAPTFEARLAKAEKQTKKRRDEQRRQRRVGTPSG